ncbi:MAG: Nif3-like dinuclear metal center hexameric protein [Lachnospiraceae bacterium]|nr:Nif3-like dinuclear metal center hexameric protein [Lachnospiraceae bacterium]
MKCHDLIELLNETADPALAEDWDNPGLLVGELEAEIRTVLVAVDATDEVIDEAVEVRADLIITHHPLIFKGISRVTDDDFVGRRVIRMIRKDICCFAMHTNFDISCMGEEAAERLGLLDAQPLQDTGEEEGYGRVGRLDAPMSVLELSEHLKEALQVEDMKVFGDLQSVVSSVAVMPGSGGSAIKDALKKKAEVLITGDISHHQGIDAVAQGLAVIDAGHFGIEKLFIPYMKEYLERNTRGLMVYCDDREVPFRIV